MACLGLACDPKPHPYPALQQSPEQRKVNFAGGLDHLNAGGLDHFNAKSTLDGFLNTP